MNTQQLNAGHTRSRVAQTMIATVLLLVSVSPLAPAETKSDYEKSFDFSKLSTWDFKHQSRPARDPVGVNQLWNKRIRSAIEGDLVGDGYQRNTTGAPSFFVAYYMGAKQRYDTRLIGYGFPGGWRSWGWGRDVDVWKLPYNESTLVVDIIDARTNQLVWRGYDSETIDLTKSEKTIQKSVDHLIKRFVKETKGET